MRLNGQTAFSAIARVTIGNQRYENRYRPTVTASHANSRARNPLIVPSWTYPLQVHGIISLIGTFGRTPVVLQLLRLKRSRRTIT